MTAEQLDAMGARIAEEVEALQAQITATADQARPVSLDDPIGRLSRMDAMQQQQMAMARVGMAQRRLEGLAAAKRRIELGTYGNCLACGEEIALGRLQARPEVGLCTDCQMERE